MALNLITAVKTAIDKIIKINTNKLDVSTFNKVFCTENNCAYTFTAGDSNYTINSHSLILVGNYVRLELKATRSSSASVGGSSSDNVPIGYLKITDDRVIDIRASTTCAWNTGPVQNYLLNTDEDNIIEVRLCGSPSTTHVNVRAVIPVAIDISKY